ncbi:Oidioi.mRNA.OKI2018_I69.XSR.g14167.t1.cds [Oikopleura dioica]|uniref:Oidioi.mRNA.OKI2018_I69.XSR.g14167.t1.cds n=1 Tax=Oikopleura dioica TaxID=34765 RepID=A0ABN7SG90_OIKDI|nr:Oidioi.mRNA.OKI2018_I69.XSR.g14167.t1.cds [Oikopleura dioica]
MTPELMKYLLQEFEFVKKIFMLFCLLFAIPITFIVVFFTWTTNKTPAYFSIPYGLTVTTCCFAMIILMRISNQLKNMIY